MNVFRFIVLDPVYWLGCMLAAWLDLLFGRNYGRDEFIDVFMDQWVILCPLFWILSLLDLIMEE